VPSLLEMREVRLQRGPHSSRRISVTDATVVLLWLLYSVFILDQALSVSPLIWQDSTSYAAVSAHSFFSMGFWAGVFPPIVPLLIRLVGSGTAFIVVQASIAVVAWGILVLAVGVHLRNGVGRVVAALLILGFACSNPITLWNNSVLSETLDLSFLVLIIAGLLFLVRRVTRTRIVCVTLASFLFAETRDTGIVTVGLIAVGLGALCLRLRRRLLEAAKSWRALVVALMYVVAITGIGLAASGRLASTTSDVYYVRVFPFPARVAWFAAHGMPQKTAIDVLSQSTFTTPGSAKAVFTQGLPEFEQLNAWLTSKGSLAYALWLLTHPIYDVTAPLVRPELAYNSAQGNLYFYEASGRTGYLASNVFWPSIPSLLVLAIVTLVLTTWQQWWRKLSWQVAAIFTGVGPLAMLIAWQGDGQETTRHTIEGLVELRLGFLLVFIFGAFGSYQPCGRESPMVSQMGLDLHRCTAQSALDPLPVNEAVSTVGRPAHSNGDSAIGIDHFIWCADKIDGG
jgi:hypothetical protein